MYRKTFRFDIQCNDLDVCSKVYVFRVFECCFEKKRLHLASKGGFDIRPLLPCAQIRTEYPWSDIEGAPLYRSVELCTTHLSGEVTALFVGLRETMEFLSLQNGGEHFGDDGMIALGTYLDPGQTRESIARTQG